MKTDKIVEQFLKDNILDGNVKVRANIPGVTKSYMLLSDILKKLAAHLYSAGEEVSDRLSIIEDFTTKLANQEDIPLDIIGVVNENFWDLLPDKHPKELTRPTVTEGVIKKKATEEMINAKIIIKKFDPNSSKYKCAQSRVDLLNKLLGL